MLFLGVSFQVYAATVAEPAVIKSVVTDEASASVSTGSGRSAGSDIVDSPLVLCYTYKSFRSQNKIIWINLQHTLVGLLSLVRCIVHSAPADDVAVKLFNRQLLKNRKSWKVSCAGKISSIQTHCRSWRWLNVCTRIDVRGGTEWYSHHFPRNIKTDLNCNLTFAHVPSRHIYNHIRTHSQLDELDTLIIYLSRNIAVDWRFLSENDKWIFENFQRD